MSVRRSPSRGVVNYIYLYGKTGMVRAARSPGECRIHLLRGTVCASPIPIVAYKHVTRVEIKPIRFPNASVLSFVK